MLCEIGARRIQPDFKRFIINDPEPADTAGVFFDEIHCAGDVLPVPSRDPFRQIVNSAGGA